MMTAGKNRLNRKARAREFNRIGGSNTNGRMLNPNHRMKLRICHSDSDLIDGTIINMTFDYDKIQTMVYKTFDTTRNLQYYNDIEQQWKPFPSTLNGSMGRYKRGHIPLPIRIPEQYLKEEYPVAGHSQLRKCIDKFVNVGYIYESDETIVIMKETIHELVHEFQRDHKYHNNPTMDTLDQTSAKIASTDQMKQWVLQQANGSYKIQSVILRFVGALDHIVQSIQYILQSKRTIRTK